MSSLSLVIQTEAGVDVRFPLKSGEQTVGRASENDIQVMHRSVSRVHATILVRPQGVRILDRESHNGTFVNGLKVVESEVVIGDQMHFGQVQGRLTGAHDVNGEDRWASESTIGQHEVPPEDPRLAVLTPAQRRVFWKLIEGNSEKEIAEGLHISVNTAHNHKRRIYEVFEISSQAALIARFRQGPGPGGRKDEG